MSDPLDRPAMLPIGRRSKLTDVGNKVLFTQLMMRHGLRVPRSWAVPFWVEGLYRRDREGALGMIAKEVGRLPSGSTFAVRSSAEREDDERSFAGQFTTLLSVPREDVPLAVEKVWLSLDQRSLENYSERPTRMGVLVQEMVRPAISGVSFSCDPLTGRRVIVTEAVEGAGSRLVQDGVSPWRYEMTKDLVLLSGEGGLTMPLLRKIVGITWRQRQRHGEEVDLEWVYDGRRLYWVQMRGLTGLRQIDRYSNTFSQEFLPGMIKPLVWSINVPMNSDAWVRLIRETTGIEVVRSENLAKSFHYRAYFNMGEFAKVFQAVGLPDDLLERMVLGHGGGMKGFRPTPVMMASLLRFVPFLLSKRRWFSDLDAVIAELNADDDRRNAEDLQLLGDEEILERVQTLRRSGVVAAYHTVLCIISSSVVTGIWRSYLKRRDMDWQRFSLKTEGDGGYPESRLMELREVMRKEGATPDNVDVCKDDRFPGTLQCLKSFLRDYGHYSESGNDFSVARWKERPDLVLRMAINTPDKGRSGDRVLKGPIVNGLQRQEARFREYREKMGSTYTRHYGLFRDYFLEIGRRLVRAGAIDQREDVFLLSLEEVESSLLRGVGDMRAVVGARRAEMSSLADLTMPPIVYGDDPPEPFREASSELRGTPSSGGYYRGLARVAGGLSDLASLQEGEVLVIPYSDVGWTPFFHLAGAVVSESGGVLSHSSIIAREYGIPAVVSVRGAMNIRNGDLLEVDGYRGEVRVLEPSDPSTSRTRPSTS